MPNERYRLANPCLHKLKRKNKTLVKILGGRQHRTTPAGQILGVATPATLSALTPMGTRLFLVAHSWPLHDVIHETGSTQHIATPPEEDQLATAVGNMHGKFGEERTCSYGVVLAGRQADRHTDIQTCCRLMRRANTMTTRSEYSTGKADPLSSAIYYHCPYAPSTCHNLGPQLITYSAPFSRVWQRKINRYFASICGS